MWRQQGRHKTGTTDGNSLHPTHQWMGNITEWSGYGYVEATRKAQERNYWRQLITSDPAMDGEHNRVVRVWLCGGNKEGTRKELLAATIASDPAMDGEHNRVVRVWLCGGNKEGTRKELLAATIPSDPAMDETWRWWVDVGTRAATHRFPSVCSMSSQSTSSGISCSSYPAITLEQNTTLTFICDAKQNWAPSFPIIVAPKK